MSKALTTEEFIQRAQKIHGNKYDYSKSIYKGCCVNIEIICKTHNESFWQTPNNHINHKRGCPKCGIKKQSKNNTKTTKQFIEDAINVHGYTYDYSKLIYINAKTIVKIICNDHGSFNQLPSHHLSGIGCPFCKSSKGEKIIRKLFKNIKINFIQQKRFIDCKNNKQLPFDFYLPDHNICIEYDGIQHFESIDFWGGKESFELCRKKDKIKNQYCFDNGIKLIRIPYWEKDNIENIITSSVLL